MLRVHQGLEPGHLFFYIALKEKYLKVYSAVSSGNVLMARMGNPRYGNIDVLVDLSSPISLGLNWNSNRSRFSVSIRYPRSSLFAILLSDSFYAGSKHLIECVLPFGNFIPERFQGLGLASVCLGVFHQKYREPGHSATKFINHLLRLWIFARQGNVPHATVNLIVLDRFAIVAEWAGIFDFRFFHF
jgi:hypothetical protein